VLRKDIARMLTVIKERALKAAPAKG